MAYSVATGAVKTPILLQEQLTPPLRVLSVIPAEEEGAAMIFAKRQVRALREVGVVSEPFFLSSRTSPFILVREWRRLRREIRSFRPDLIHAHFGTMTAFFCALSGTRPLVVTYRGSDLNPCPNIPRLRSQVFAIFRMTSKAMLKSFASGGRTCNRMKTISQF